MKKIISALLCTLLVIATTSCGSMNNTQKGALIGSGSGAALGAGVGALFGKGKGAAIGGVIGTAIGATAGTLIGKKMDKAKAQAEAIENAKVESVTDVNGLQAVKVTFDSGILFASGKSDLQADAMQSLSKFANEVLMQNADMDVAIKGYTDNAGWKGCTAEQSAAKNETLSLQRAQSVSTYLTKLGVSTSQIKSIEGLGEANPVADNTTAAGMQQNRRVEVYLYASEAMINAANNGTLK